MSETRGEEVTLYVCPDCRSGHQVEPNMAAGCACMHPGEEGEYAPIDQPVTAYVPPPGSVCVVLSEEEVKRALHELPRPRADHAGCEVCEQIDSLRSKLRAALPTKEENDG